MISLEQIETDLKEALKAKNQLAADTLRGLKVRIQNEKISKMSRGAGSGSAGNELSEEEMVALVKSEVKRRKESAESFTAGGRAEMAEKEMREAAILEKYMPAQMSEEQMAALVDSILAENNFTAADFGKAMGAVKVKAGQSADGAMLAKILKEKLK